jgi:hypothetical membrane protein
MASRTPTTWLIAAGIVGPILFFAVALVEGATRQGYDPVRQFISLLSLGEGGWIQVVNFIVSGLLFVAFGIGLRRRWTSGPGRRWVPRLLAIVGLALVWSGVFVTDPALGYPAGAPAGLPTNASWHAGLHYLGASVVFIGLPAATFIAARRASRAGSRGWAVHAVTSGLFMLFGWLAGFVIVGPDGVSSIAGLLQRIAVLAGWQWVVAIALVELGRVGRPMAAEPA